MTAEHLIFSTNVEYLVEDIIESIEDNRFDLGAPEGQVISISDVLLEIAVNYEEFDRFENLHVEDSAGVSYNFSITEAEAENSNFAPQTISVPNQRHQHLPETITVVEIAQIELVAPQMEWAKNLPLDSAGRLEAFQVLQYLSEHPEELASIMRQSTQLVDEANRSYSPW